MPSGWNCCTNWCLKPRPLLCLAKPPIPHLMLGCRILRLQLGRWGCRFSWQESRPDELEAAFTKFTQASAGALLRQRQSLFHQRAQHDRCNLAARHAIPAAYDLRDQVAAGGLISYSSSIAGAYRQAGVYAGQILKGAKPSELPVQQPTTFELVINLKTAKDPRPYRATVATHCRH